MEVSNYISSFLLILYLKYFVFLSFDDGLQNQRDLKPYPFTEFSVCMPAGSNVLQTENKRKLPVAWWLKLMSYLPSRELSNPGYYKIYRYCTFSGEDLNNLFLKNRNLRL
ncbi:MAG: hypothetical protein R6W78_18335 [Bacteroidales bacterium]